MKWGQAVEQKPTGKEMKLFYDDCIRSLTAIHEAGFVHTDVRWGNILKFPNGHYVMVDFGEAVKVGTYVNCSGFSKNRLDLIPHKFWTGSGLGACQWLAQRRF